MTPIQRTRLLYYCQSLVGIGHLTASLHIIQELLPHFDVDLIYGGIGYTAFPQQGGFRVLQLPSLLFNDAGELYPPQQDCTVDSIWQQRRLCIDTFLNTPYQGIILEFYPFGRRRFKQEIRRFCKHVKATSGDIPVFSQVREILVPTDLAEEESILHIVNNEIHTVLVRGDPKVVSFDETFSLTPALGERLFYGGYVSQPPPTQWPQRSQQILVSQGGGNVGRQLLVTAIQCATLLPQFQFIIATGSTASAEDRAALQALIQSHNVTVVAFLSGFRQQLLSSALSINMGGDNTLLDVIATRTPSLAYPYPGNSEQALRIQKLAEQGWVTPLSEADLNPQTLKTHILQALNQPYPQHTINLNGAVNIGNKIREIISSR
jgi:predicted glycosyltransferase